MSEEEKKKRRKMQKVSFCYHEPPQPNDGIGAHASEESLLVFIIYVEAVISTRRWFIC